MNTPAQVTEAHKQLVATIVEQAFRFAEGNHKITPLSQLIADSEALATAELKKRADHWCDMHTVCAKERDQLRAELATCKDASEALVESLRAEAERLKRDYDYDHKCLHEVRERCELWKQRAERAEAELATAKAIIASIEEDGTEEHNAAVRLRQELATERARLDWLLSRMGGNVLPVNKCVAWTVDVYHYKNQFPSRAAIDAAIKEAP